MQAIRLHDVHSAQRDLPYHTDTGCKRLGGEGHASAHCDKTVPSPGFEPGAEYEFKVALGAANASGVFVKATVNGPRMEGVVIGEIFLRIRRTQRRVRYTQAMANSRRTPVYSWSIGRAASSRRALDGSTLCRRRNNRPANISGGRLGGGRASQRVFVYTSEAVRPWHRLLQRVARAEGSHPERTDGGYWLDLWKEDPRLGERNMEACAWSKDTGLSGNARFFC